MRSREGVTRFEVRGARCETVEPVELVHWLKGCCASPVVSRRSREKSGQTTGIRGACSVVVFLLLLLLSPCPSFLGPLVSYAHGEELNLQALIDEAMKNSPEILAAGSKTEAAAFRIPQAGSLPDPMFMLGYQNEGWERYTFNEMPMAQWMFSISQMFPFYGKRSLKGEMAAKDVEGLRAQQDSLKLRIAGRIKELYYELFLAYKNIDILKDKVALFSRIEEAALARYSSGMASQQEALMAQTEKYMLLEKEEMQRQKIDAIEGMLNSAAGRHVNSPLGRPGEPLSTPLAQTMDESIDTMLTSSPELRSRTRMVEAAEAKLKMAKKEYYPDFTFNASVFKRSWQFRQPGENEDVWSLTTTINIPIFFKSKQDKAVLEANAAISEARYEFQAARYMIQSALRDSYAMIRTADKLMGIYKGALIPKTYQDFELAIAGYVSGKVEAITAISRLKVLLDYELLYWTQFTEREKAIVRVGVVTGSGTGGRTK